MLSRASIFAIIIFVTFIFSIAFLSSITTATSDSYKNIKSVTFYDFPATNEQRLQHLKEALPQIKASGINTIWLVSSWRTYNPKPLANPPIYSDSEFETLKETLRLLKENNMKVILGLNYLGQGWSPEGIDACNWIRNATMYDAFETYVKEFLTRISDYNDSVYILFFTENSVPCGMFNRTNATYVAALLRPTLGSLPSRLPSDLRSKFRIGYHDYTLINLGWAGGDSPIKDPIGFDFLSFVAYYPFYDNATMSIQEGMALRVSRFRALYPNTPLIIGEFGASSCGSNGESYQAQIDGALVNYSVSHDFGFNLWGWRPLYPASLECTSPVGGGLAITNQDGSPKKTVYVLSSILGPKIESGGINTQYQPWAVWLIGKNLNSNLVVQLFDGSSTWGGNRSITLSTDETWLSFQLPSNIPPSGCNIGNSCTISAMLIDQNSGLSSNKFPLTLPNTTTTTSQTITTTTTESTTSTTSTTSPQTSTTSTTKSTTSTTTSSTTSTTITNLPECKCSWFVCNQNCGSKSGNYCLFDNNCLETTTTSTTSTSTTTTTISSSSTTLKPATTSTSQNLPINLPNVDLRIVGVAVLAIIIPIVIFYLVKI